VSEICIYCFVYVVSNILYVCRVSKKVIFNQNSKYKKIPNPRIEEKSKCVEGQNFVRIVSSILYMSGDHIYRFAYTVFWILYVCRVTDFFQSQNFLYFVL